MASLLEPDLGSRSNAWLNHYLTQEDRRTRVNAQTSLQNVHLNVCPGLRQTRSQTHTLRLAEEADSAAAAGPLSTTPMRSRVWITVVDAGRI